MSFPFFFSFFFPNVDVRCQTVLAENEKKNKKRRMEEEKKVHRRKRARKRPLIDCWNRNREINLRVWRCTSFFFREREMEEKNVSKPLHPKTVHYQSIPSSDVNTQSVN